MDSDSPLNSHRRLLDSDLNADLEAGIEPLIEEDLDNPAAEITKQELLNVVKTLSAKLEDLTTCSNLIDRHGSALISSLASLNVERAALAASPNPSDQSGLKDAIKTVTERAALLKLTSAAMVKGSADFVQACKNDGRRWQRVLENEREIRQRLENMVEQYAQQHTNLEDQIRHKYHVKDPTEAVEVEEQPQEVAVENVQSGSDEDDDDFHDACDDEDQVFMISAPPNYEAKHHEAVRGHSRKKSESSSKEDDLESSDLDEDASGSGLNNQIQIVQKKQEVLTSSQPMSASPDLQQINTTSTASKARKRRSCIPDKPNLTISLWSIVKNSIGKDLTKIPVPVNFSEPLSMLQRLTEDFEYSEILDKAALCTDDCEQMAFVAAFTVSSYSTTAIRTGKPFNPLLGETYEWDRSEDLGFRVISEQVSHHPPMVAQYCESSKGLWKCWQEFSMRSKFKGKYLEVEPLGLTHLQFENSGNHYTWRKVKTVVHNIVIGKLWIDQHGEMKVVNHAKDIKCHMKFEPYSYFGGTPKKVTGSVVDANEKVTWVLKGTWDSTLEGSPVIKETTVKGKSSLEIGPTETLWKVNPVNPEAEKYYNFTKLACELNEVHNRIH